MTRTGRNVICLVKGDERFVFLYDDHVDSRRVLLETLGYMAADKELAFSWYDAAVVSQRIHTKPDWEGTIPE